VRVRYVFFCFAKGRGVQLFFIFFSLMLAHSRVPIARERRCRRCLRHRRASRCAPCSFFYLFSSLSLRENLRISSWWRC